MKVYKEKYGNNSQSGGNKGKFSGQKQGSQQNSSQQQAKQAVASSQGTKVATPVQVGPEQSVPQKKGFLARLKELFGGGTKSSKSDNK